MTTKRQRGRTVTDAIARYPLERLATAQSIRDEHRAEMDEAAAQLPVKVRLADGRTLLSEGPSSGGRAYRCMDGMVVVVSYDPSPHGLLLHLSISYAQRDPRWTDLKALRAAFFPDDIDVIQVLPRAGEFINVHPHAFHLFQCPEQWQGGWNV